MVVDAPMMSRFNQGMLREGVLKSWASKYYPSLAHAVDDVEASRKVMLTQWG